MHHVNVFVIYRLIYWVGGGRPELEAERFLLLCFNSARLTESLLFGCPAVVYYNVYDSFHENLTVGSKVDTQTNWELCNLKRLLFMVESRLTSKGNKK